MHNSISCAVVFMKNVQKCSSCTIVLPFVHHIRVAEKKNHKHPKYDIYVLLSVPVCKIRPTKIRMFANQLYPKLRIMHKKRRFHDTPVQLVMNVHRFASCATGQVMLRSSALCPYSTKAKDMVKSTVSLLFASLCTKELEPRWAAP